MADPSPRVRRAWRGLPFTVWASALACGVVLLVLGLAFFVSQAWRVRDLPRQEAVVVAVAEWRPGGCGDDPSSVITYRLLAPAPGGSEEITDADSCEHVTVGERLHIVVIGEGPDVEVLADPPATLGEAVLLSVLVGIAGAVLGFVVAGWQHLAGLLWSRVGRRRGTRRSSQAPDAGHDDGPHRR